MDRSRKFLILIVVLAGLVLVAQTARAQRALLPSQSESATPPSVEEDLPPAIVEKITKMVRTHSSLADMRVEVRVGRVRQRLGECPQALETVISGKDRPWGGFSVMVRCPQPFWAVSVPVQTRVFGPQLTASKYLPQGIRLKPDDLSVVTTDITRTRSDTARSIDDAVGRVLSQPLQQGAILTLNMLKEEAVIKVGEAVRLQVQGKGFSAIGEGKAVSAGAIGDSIRVRLPDGQQVTGRVVRSGVVEVLIQ
ncbi:MAG: flagellar basal body P-ring formation protein FlgA [Burkholderiaceae bacterium]|nr:flagellar basal body P-ring formation protein FlgA [Burkholderiaceae bacterium]